jgi:hypothetical protein
MDAVLQHYYYTCAILYHSPPLRQQRPCVLGVSERLRICAVQLSKGCSIIKGVGLVKLIECS